jgi:NADH dehydrogenase [ubiquinone] 1 alpha subcomplex assembly factor 2
MDLTDDPTQNCEPSKLGWFIMSQGMMMCIPATRHAHLRHLTRLTWAPQTGLDLQGNTYWEFRDVRGDPSDPRIRWRRIVKYPRNTHYGEVKVPPQWHQWLRHTRDAPPSIPEQQAEVRRQAQIKVLAAEADARWAAKPSLLDAAGSGSDAPGQVGAGQPVPALGSRVARGQEAQGAAAPGEGEGETRRDAVASGPEQRAGAVAGDKKGTWRQSRRGGPSEDWQPQAWTPPAPKR